MTVIDNAIYVDGHRTSDPSSLDQTFEEMSARHGMAWIGLYRPDEAELREIAHEFALHPLAVEDALVGHQRPKLERYDDFVQNAELLRCCDERGALHDLQAQGLALN